jgi:hypothetical protein
MKLNPKAWIIGDGAVTEYKDTAKRYKQMGDTVIPLYAIPEGYALVPIEPTDGMTFIGQSMRYESLNSIGSIYKAMIAAAQDKK